MFELNKNSLFFVAKIGLAMTFFVAMAACSHEQVRMESMVDAPAEALAVPDAPAHAPELPDQLARQQATHRHHVRRHHVSAKVAKNHVHAKKHKALSTQAVARVSKPNATTPNFMPPPPPAPITPVMLTTPKGTSGNEWALWVFCAAAVGLVLFGVRKRKNASPRRGRRGLVYNN